MSVWICDAATGQLVVGEASLQAPDDSAPPCVLVEQHRRDPGLWRVWQLFTGKRFSSGNSRLGHSVYFTITTLSTVAFGDIVPVTSAARWFVISLVVIGLGVFFSAIAPVLGPEISGELNHLFNPKEKAREPMARCFWEATPKRCRSRPAQPRLRCWRQTESR
jgi:hypothetical protein